jgi:hypothetical protein
MLIIGLNEKPSQYDTDNWHGYGIPISRFGIKHSVVTHMKEWVFQECVHNDNEERFWSTYRLWLNKSRGYKKLENAQIYNTGFETYYTFFRPHVTFKGKTPAKGYDKVPPWYYPIVRGFIMKNLELAVVEGGEIKFPDKSDKNQIRKDTQNRLCVKNYALPK